MAFTLVRTEVELRDGVTELATGGYLESDVIRKSLRASRKVCCPLACYVV